MKKAFTLAEVLITLGIIGIVAALTMPALIADYQKKAAVTRLKQTYSMLNQALLSSIAENGEITEWNIDGLNSPADVFDKYIAPYMKIIKRTNLSVLRANAEFLELSGAPETDLRIMGNGNNPMTYSLANGTTLFVSTYPLSNDDITRIGLGVDIDGVKKVNQFGKDLFTMDLTQQRMAMSGTLSEEECTEACLGADYTREDIKNGTQLVGPEKNTDFQYGCNKQSRGMWCGALIQADGWEIKDDYPW